MKWIDYSTLLVVLGALVALTNAIVQVVKQITWDKLPTQLVALTVAQVLTFVAGLGWMQLNSITIMWYMIAALAVIGFLVAYAAMFGFEKLKEVLEQCRKR